MVSRYADLSLDKLGPPPEHLSKNQRAYHFILEVSLLGVFASYMRLSHYLEEISAKDVDAQVPLWVELVAFIDHANRLRRVLFEFPGLVRKRQRFEQLSGLLESVEVFRNHLQHPDNMKKPGYTRTPLGVLSWLYDPGNGAGGRVWRFAGFFHSSDAEISMPILLGEPSLVPIGNVNYGLGGPEALRVTDIFLSILEVPRSYLSALDAIRLDSRSGI